MTAKPSVIARMASTYCTIHRRRLVVAGARVSARIAHTAASATAQKVSSVSARRPSATWSGEVAVSAVARRATREAARRAAITHVNPSAAIPPRVDSQPTVPGSQPRISVAPAPMRLNPQRSGDG